MHIGSPRESIPRFSLRVSFIDWYSYKYFAPTALARMIIPYIAESFKSISQTIANGGVIAFRTDTFYGLGANPFDRAAVQSIKELKGREDHKPILIVISDRDQVERFISKPSHSFQLLSENFWPGALTLIG